MKVSIDSRTIQPGETFIPIKGPNFDGHDYIEDVIAKGGRILDVDLADYTKKYRRKLKAHVIGITGSVGKTTTKEMLYAVLKQRFKVVKTHHNQNNEIGAPLTVLKAEHDTDIILVEMGMRYSGDINYLSRIIRPQTVIVTGISSVHSAHFKDLKEIAKAKAEIFTSPLQWESKERVAYVNYSSQYSEFLKKKASSKGFRVLPFQGENKISAMVNLCFMVGQQFGLSEEHIQKGLKSIETQPHRLQKHEVGGVTIIDDTYNANPEGVCYALDYLKQFRGRKIFVFADMKELGEQSEAAHRKVFDDAYEAGIDILFTIGPEISQVLKNYHETRNLEHYHFEHMSDLNAQLKAELKPQDFVLIKGSRSMKMEETVAFLTQH